MSKIWSGYLETYEMVDIFVEMQMSYFICREVIRRFQDKSSATCWYQNLKQLQTCKYRYQS